MRIGVTGHMNLTADTAQLVYAEITRQITATGRATDEAANEVVVRSCDRLIAVWDGEIGERSGTGSVVALARERGVPLTIVWPQGAARG